MSEREVVLPRPALVVAGGCMACFMTRALDVSLFVDAVSCRFRVEGRCWGETLCSGRMLSWRAKLGGVARGRE
jgi:hypothetical protein